MTNGFRKLTAVVVLIPLGLSAAGGSSRAQSPDQDDASSPRPAPLVSGPSDRAEGPDQDDELNLADLTAYRAALSGKATADSARASDPPARAGFRDLWARSDAHRGRRVTVQGRVERIFRQGPVGSFPSLIQVWVYSPAGDPFCLVFPRPAGPTTPGSEPEHRAASQAVNRQAADAHVTPPAIPGLGQTVEFTGTFLKMVRYTAGDGPRLAPLIVGDRAVAGIAERGPRDSALVRQARLTFLPGPDPPRHRGRGLRCLRPRSLGLVTDKLGAGPDAGGRRGRDPRRAAPSWGPDPRRSARRNRLLDPAAADSLSFVDDMPEPRV